jgi:hypothetical protein
VDQHRVVDVLCLDAYLRPRGPQDPGVLYAPEMIVADLPGLEVRCAERVRRPGADTGGVVDAIDALVSAVWP